MAKQIAKLAVNNTVQTIKSIGTPTNQGTITHAIDIAADGELPYYQIIFSDNTLRIVREDNLTKIK